VPDFDQDWVVRWFAEPDKYFGEGVKKLRWATQLQTEFTGDSLTTEQLRHNARVRAARRWSTDYASRDRAAFQDELKRKDSEHGVE
jgi:hypothetical protein